MEFKDSNAQIDRICRSVFAETVLIRIEVKTVYAKPDFIAKQEACRKSVAETLSRAHQDILALMEKVTITCV